MNALKTIIYFSIFKYPLTKDEIFSFSSHKSLKVVEHELELLIAKKAIFNFGEFYSSSDNYNYVERRLRGNKMAKAVMPKALKRAKRIMSFPYIKSVSISGSLAKGYHDENCDVDYFIITKPGRLWLARTLLVLYKKVFLLNSNKYFCVNYFISSNRYEITEKNTFTAVELSTLIPTYGELIFREFVKANTWVDKILPNKKTNYQHVIAQYEKPFWSLCLEFVFNTGFGTYLDRIFKKITIKKWRSKFKYLAESDFEIAMKSTNDVSKHHPQNFQSKVINSLDEQYNLKTKTFNLNLSMENA